MKTNTPPPIEIQIEILLTREAATHIRASESTMEKWRLKGVGPAFVRIGPRKIGYLRRDLDEWLAGCRRRSTSEPAR